jgi:hypothetical protein
MIMKNDTQLEQMKREDWGRQRKKLNKQKSNTQKRKRRWKLFTLVYKSFDYKV